jgi:hypothetical protein
MRVSADTYVTGPGLVESLSVDTVKRTKERQVSFGGGRQDY